VDLLGVVAGEEHRARAARRARGLEARDLGERVRRGDRLALVGLRQHVVEAVDAEIVDDLHALARLADLAADVVTQPGPQVAGRAQPVQAVGVVRVEPVAGPVERQRVEHRGRELLRERLRRRQRALELGEQLVLARQRAGGLGRRGLDPRPERLRQARLREHPQPRPAADHVGQPRDRVAILLDGHVRPVAGRHGVEPPRLLEDRVRAEGLARGERGSCWRFG
jgi:hypothetical protein